MFFLRLLAVILFIFSSSSAWAMGDTSGLRTPHPLIGKESADVVLSKSDGTTSSIKSALQGKKSILVFWATWCPHCYEELGAINDNFSAIEQKGINIVLIDIGETRMDVNNYFSRRQMKLVSFLDQDSYLQQADHLVGVPTLIFVDEKGIIRSVTHAFPSDYENYFSVK